MTETEIYNVISKKHKLRGDFILRECKNGYTQMAAPGVLSKFDVWVMARSWTNPCITIYEIKSARSDFLRDTKWPKYLDYCNQFAFACEPGVIDPDEVQIGVGLYYVKPDGYIRAAKKPLYRTVEISADMYKYIIMCRLDNDDRPMTREEMSEKRQEKLRAWVEGKIESKDLGYLVCSKLIKKVQEFDAKMAGKEKSIQYLEAREKDYEEILKVLREEGMIRSTYSGSAAIEIKQYFQAKNPARSRVITRTIADLENVLGYLKILSKEDEQG